MAEKRNNEKEKQLEKVKSKTRRTSIKKQQKILSKKHIKKIKKVRH